MCHEDQSLHNQMITSDSFGKKQFAITLINIMKTHFHVIVKCYSMTVENYGNTAHLKICLYL